MNNKLSNNYSNSRINPKLEKHFYNLSNMIRTSSFLFSFPELRQFAFFMIFLKRLIDTEYFKEKEIYNLYENIHFQIEGSKNNFINSLFRICDILKSSNPLFKDVLFPSWSPNNLSISQLSKIDILIRTIAKENYDFSHFSEIEFGSAFNLLIHYTKETKTAEYYTPKTIKEIMVELLEVNTTHSIYDPTVGIGGFFVEVGNNFENRGISDNSIQYYGQEVNQQIFSFFVMNMLMNGIENFVPYLGDTILNPLNIRNGSLLKFDRIIADPPLGLSSYRYDEFYRNDRYYRFQDVVPGKNSSAAFLQHILASLKESGKAVVLLNQAILYSSSDSQLRIKLIENDLIESIITLPSGILEFTNASPVILVINKSKEQDKKNKVQMINFSEKFTLEEFQNQNFKSILKELRYSNDPNINSCLISARQIINNNYILDPERYSKETQRIQKLVEQNKGVILSEISQIIRGTQTNLDSTYSYKSIRPLVTIKDLNREITSKNIEVKNLKVDHINGREISDRCILVALVGNDLKPTIFDPNSSSNGPEAIIIGNNVVAIMPDEKLVRLEYLYYQLYGSEVQEQISSIRKGVIPNFSMAQLREIIVPMPSFGNNEISLREQDVFIEQQTRNLLELEELRFKERVKELDINKAAIEIESTTIRTLAHNILPIVTTSSMALIRLKKHLEENNIIDSKLLESNFIVVDPEIKEHLSSIESSQSVKEIIESVEGNLEHMQNVISKTRDIITQSIKEYDFEIYNFKKLMEDFIAQKKMEYENLFEIRLHCPTDVEVKISRTHFIDILNNLLWNAKAHAFDNQERHTKRIIEFNIEQIEGLDQIIFTYKNNGRKLEISEQEYFQALKKSKNSSGFGLGGFFIKTMIQQLNGKVNLVKREKGFEMKIILPIPKNRSENAE